MSVDLERPRTGHDILFYLSVRCAAVLIAYDGRTPAVKFKNVAIRCGLTGVASRNPAGSSNGSYAGRMARLAVNELIGLGLAHREGDDVVAEDLADLAGWLADQVDEDYRPDEVRPEEQARQADPRHLWRRAGHDVERFADLMREHGHPDNHPALAAARRGERWTPAP